MSCYDYSDYDENQKILQIIRFVAPDLDDVTDNIVDVTINLQDLMCGKSGSASFTTKL